MAARLARKGWNVTMDPVCGYAFLEPAMPAEVLAGCVQAQSAIAAATIGASAIAKAMWWQFAATLGAGAMAVLGGGFVVIAAWLQIRAQKSEADAGKRTEAEAYRVWVTALASELQKQFKDLRSQSEQERDNWRRSGGTIDLRLTWPAFVEEFKSTAWRQHALLGSKTVQLIAALDRNHLALEGFCLLNATRDLDDYVHPPEGPTPQPIIEAYCEKLALVEKSIEALKEELTGN